MSNIGTFNPDEHREISESPEQPRVELEILDHAFDRDKNPSIDKAHPEQIQNNNSGFTTVSRATISTSYSPEGRVAASVPTPYLKARESAGRSVPTLIGEPESPDAYLLLPSTARQCPNINLNGGDQGVFKIADAELDTRQMTFLTKAGLFSNTTYCYDCAYFGAYDNNYNIYYVCDSLEQEKGKLIQKWEELIQTGKIKFIEEEKVVNYSANISPPSLDMATAEIKEQVKQADWIVHFPQKHSMFVHDGKLKLFDWADGIANNWSITVFDLPSEVENVTAAGLDPKENFLLLGSGNTLYVLDHHKKPMEVVQKLENIDSELDGIISLRSDGSILAGDRKGGLTKIISNLRTFPSRRERLEQQRALQRLRIKKREGRFKTGEPPTPSVSPEIKEISNEIIAQFTDDISNASSLDEINTLRAELRTQKSEYETEVNDRRIIDAIFDPVFALLSQKENEILSVQLETETTAIRGLIGRIGGMSLQDLAAARSRVDRLRVTVLSSNLDKKKKTEVTQMSDDFSSKAREVLARDEERLLTQLDSLFSDAKQKLTEIDKLSDFEIWQASDYPAFLDALNGQMRIVPASHGKVLEKLRKMEGDMRELKRQSEAKFKEEYKKVREQAANRTDIAVSVAAGRVEEFLEMFEKEVHKKSFRTAEEAKQWVERSTLYTSVLGVLEVLNLQDPEKAEELRKKLKVEVAQLSYEVKRLKDAKVDDVTGRQMVIFGEVSFPVWEHRVEGGEQNVKIELAYKVDNASKGPGIKPEDYMCELFYKVTDENGKVHEIPMHSEDTLKYGRYDERFYEGGSYFPSHLSLGHARKMLSSIKAKESKRASEVTRRYDEFQRKIREVNMQIKNSKERTSENLNALQEERANLTKKYIGFLDESGLYGWFALRAFKNRYHNGEDMEGGPEQGRISDWASYWIVDEDTDKALEKFAQMSKMSLNLREGIISLEGHAGTGKDVLVQMFSHKTNRPLYSFDCTKWTTEFDLSQDVSLAAEEGASYTVKEDSVIVKALETPGAILYFNEFNAMPEQAQIFLHSLFDAKRQITLKTSSGRVVKADPSVIICSSMNPGYPGTSHPQFATRSRMVPIKLDFPEFKKTDKNGVITYASSEALRIARSVKSLQDLTYNPDMEENEFAELWDAYINKGVANGSLTPERKFDIEVIFALITFATQIREGFINKIAKRGGRKTFSISQPFTLREMRRCAHILSTMDSSKKQNPDNAEAMAKDLVRQFYSQYIFDEKEAEELERNLAQWTTQKPMRTGRAVATP